MAPKRIPNHPSLDHYRKQAKELLKAYTSGEAQAVARFRQDHPRGTKAEGASSAFQLSDAQWVLAREHGFESWPKFVRHLEDQASPRDARGLRPASIRLEVPTAREVNLGVFLHDHSRILTATEAEPVRLWDAVTGKLRHEFGGYSHHAWALKPSADDRSLIVGCRDGSLRVVDMETEHVVQTLTGHRALVRCIDATADLKLAISGAAMRDHDLRLWDVPSGACTKELKGHRDGIYCVAFDRAQRRALSGSRDTDVRLWDLDSGDCVNVFKGHAYHVHAVAWSADGRTALSCSQDIRLWDIESGRCLRVFDGHTETIRSVAWSPDQRLAASAAHDGTVRVWNVESGECTHVFAGHSTGAINAVWTSNHRLVSCDWNGEVRTWDLAAAHAPGQS